MFFLSIELHEHKSNATIPFAHLSIFSTLYEWLKCVVHFVILHRYRFFHYHSKLNTLYDEII